MNLVGTGIGQIRRIETLDGHEIVERLEAMDNAKRVYRYSLVAGVPASHYAGMIEVKPNGGGSIANWRVDFLASKQPDIVVKDMVSALERTGLENLTARFGAVK